MMEQKGLQLGPRGPRGISLSFPYRIKLELAPSLLHIQLGARAAVRSSQQDRYMAIPPAS